MVTVKLVKLVLPNKKYLKSYREYLRESLRAKDRDEAEVEHNLEQLKNPDAFFKKLSDERQGLNLEKGRVPQSVFWLVGGNKFIGGISIRHKLNNRLKFIGGHVGYKIRPSLRGRGYGSIILRLALPKIRQIGLKKIIITCDKDNIASRKIIENSGGVCVWSGKVSEYNKPILRYYIKL